MGIQVVEFQPEMKRELTILHETVIVLKVGPILMAFMAIAWRGRPRECPRQYSRID